jgi:hypothetical protein
MVETVLTLSTLRKTWILDLDGTLVRHNGYKDGSEAFLPGAIKFLRDIDADDFVMILTAREEGARAATEAFLEDNGVRYDMLMFEMPMGERVLLNDSKPSGLKTAYAVECSRNEGLEKLGVVIDKSL